MTKHLIFRHVVILCFSLAFITAGDLFSQTNRGMKTITVRTKVGEEIQLYKDSYALVVGNGSYTNGWDPLAGALKDVKEVAAALEKHGFHVTLKTDLRKTDFETAFEAFIENGRDEDSRLLFYYAGHGHTETLRTGEKLGYLIMVDSPKPTATGKNDRSKNVDMESLVTQAKRIDALHVLYMFDSCFSGSILNARNIPQPPAIQGPRQISRAAVYHCGPARMSRCRTIVDLNGRFWICLKAKLTNRFRTVTSPVKSWDCI